MKKILCMLIASVMLMSVCPTTIFATDTANSSDETIGAATTSTADEADKWLFFQEFSDIYACPEYGDPVAFYEELYYHYNSDGAVEWALVYGHLTIAPPWYSKPLAVLEDRIIRVDMTDIGPFSANYGIYVVNEHKFIDMARALEEDTYHDEIYTYLNENNIGEIIGDMDNDRKLTVKDATYIQKCLADIISFPENDAVKANEEQSGGYGYLAYLSDFNRDNVRNIKDATAIQKYIAGITE